MSIDLDHLESLAKAATPGPWDYGACEVFLKGTDFWPVIATCRNEDDLAFIAAANPAVVLELIAELRRVSDMVRKEREARNWLATMLGEYGKEDGSAQEWLDEARRIAGIITEEQTQKPNSRRTPNE